MHFIKTITTSLSLVSIAWCSEIDIHARQSPNERVVQIVTVSDTSGALKFFPEQVVADVGSVIQFQFYPKVKIPLISRLDFTNTWNRITL